MPQPPKRNKTLDLKWNLGFWQENAEGGKRKREKDKKGGVGGRKRKWIEKYGAFELKVVCLCVCVCELCYYEVIVVLVKTND